MHHAFLFTGTRGVGKTTIARILAKCLNCETGVTATPCGTCAACQEIDEGRFVDLIEVDAASRTKVDDTRELLENVQYAPTRGRYKVYLIDEVHMLSTHSFNALLKTLEEPPPHVKFLLATTDPQKLPVTVLSRCLQFNLKRLPVALIGEHLDEGARRREDFVTSPPRCGSSRRRPTAACAMRCRCSISSSRSAAARSTRPAHGRCWAPSIAIMCAKLARALATGDAREAARDRAHARGVLSGLRRRCSTSSPRCSRAWRCASSCRVTRAMSCSIRRCWPSSPRRFSAEDVQLYYQTAILGRRDLPFAPDPRTGFEMTLVRMLAFRPAGGAARARAPAASARRRGARGRRALRRPGAAPIVRPASAGPIDPVQWARVIGDLDVTRRGAPARGQLRACSSIAATLLRFAVDPKVARTPPQVEQLAQALAKYLGGHVKLEFVEGAPPVETPSQHGDGARPRRSMPRGARSRKTRRCAK